MTLQDQVIDASAVILSQPQILGKIRQYGLELDHELSQAEILSVTIPDGISWYITDGKSSFQIKGKTIWMMYLLSKDDLELLERDSLIPGLEK